ncbi:hypothetical protein HDV05_003791 [Chytridiales sp. JEL 0842]|nr:hypothetical protein HDV05_003791 [Chytridiales sp. JEL 0842]
MVSFHLLQRGVFYFTVMGTNMLPLLKHGMDVYYFKRYQFATSTGPACQRLLFPLVCYDTFGTNWTLYTEVGCGSVIALLTLILVGFHSLLAIYYLVASCGTTPSKANDFLAGAEDGCCGVAAVVLSFGAYDSDVEGHRKIASKWRRVTRLITSGFQLAIIVAVCAGLSLVTKAEGVLEIQRSSLFVLLPCLMLNIYMWLENVFEGFKIMYE